MQRWFLARDIVSNFMYAPSDDSGKVSRYTQIVSEFFAPTLNDVPVVTDVVNKYKTSKTSAVILASTKEIAWHRKG